MAESKRQSITGRVATPKMGAAKDVIDGDSALYKAVGARVRVTSAPENEKLEGILFTVSNHTNTIAIDTAPLPPNPSSSMQNKLCDFHIIPVAHITSFEVIGAGEKAQGSGTGFDGALPPITKVDPEALRAREEQTIRDIKKRDAQRGKGVTREAQEIFDFVARTLPTRWDESRIIVNDAVVIESPYAVENIKAAKGREQSLPHVRKVVDRYYQLKKEKERAARAPPVATPIAPRKGG